MTMNNSNNGELSSTFNLSLITENSSLLDDFNIYRRVTSVMFAMVPAVIGSLLLFGLAGNVFVIYITVTTQRVIQHQLHSMLVVNLAVGDLIYLLSSGLYQAIAFSVPGWIYGSCMCPLLHFLNIQTMGSSIFTMCALAIMRFAALLMPFQIRNSFVQRSEKTAGILILSLVWTAASFLALPNVFYFRLVDHSQVKSSSDVGLECAWRDKEAEDKYRIALFVITFIVPFLLISILYTFIGREVFCFIRTKKPQVDKERKEYVKTTLMVLFLVLAFLICWFPYHFFALREVSNQYQSFSHATSRLILRLAAHCFSYAHACMNPIVYTFAAPGFRRHVFLCCTRRRKVFDECCFNEHSSKTCCCVFGNVNRGERVELTIVTVRQSPGRGSLVTQTTVERPKESGGSSASEKCFDLDEAKKLVQNDGNEKQKNVE